VTTGDMTLPDGLSGGYWFYEAAYVVSAAAMTLGFSLRTEGRENMPRQGPALLIANHQSYLDPVLVGLASRRHLCFLARKTLFHNPLFARLIYRLNAVPIDQEGVGKEGIRTIENQLRRGQAVVVFPEGERTADGQVHPLKPGIHLLIRRTKAPIVPVGIAGAFEAWPRWRRFPIPAPLFLPAGRGALAVTVGRPLDAARFTALPRDQALGDLFTELKTMFDRAEHLRRK
jgi:1-acyl-sn-glycerol-3-phosphate acyltransferase